MPESRYRPVPPRKRWSLTPSAAHARVKLGDPVLAELVGAGRSELRQLGRDDLAHLAERAGDQRDPRALRPRTWPSSRRCDRLVVGVGVHEQQAASPGLEGCSHGRRLAGGRRVGPTDGRIWDHDGELPAGSRRGRSAVLRSACPGPFQVAPDGSRVAFLRSRGRRRPGDLPVGNWTWAPGTRNVLSPTRRSLGAGRVRTSPPQERARRERVRETAARDRRRSPQTGRRRVAVFALSGQVYVAPLAALPAWPAPVAQRRRHGGARARPAGSIPRPDPTARVADDTTARCVSSTSRPAGTPRWPTAGKTVSPSAWPSSSPPRRWAVPAAAGGRRTAARLLVARVDEARRQSAGTSPTRRTRIKPARRGGLSRSAGTPNADVSLCIAELAGLGGPSDAWGCGWGWAQQRRLGPRRVPVPGHRSAGTIPATR